MMKVQPQLLPYHQPIQEITLHFLVKVSSDTSSGLNIIATLSVATYEDVTVTIDTSGTATEGTDYNSLSNITISAGNTTGTYK